MICPLPSLCFWSDILTKIATLTSDLLRRLPLLCNSYKNIIGSKYSMSSAKFVFFGLICQHRCLSWCLQTNIQILPVTADIILKKNWQEAGYVLYKVCVLIDGDRPMSGYNYTFPICRCSACLQCRGFIFQILHARLCAVMTLKFC